MAEPEPGYIESFKGATGVAAMFGTGLYRTTYGKSDLRLDLIFLDLVVKALLLKMYQMTSRETKAITPHIILINAGDFDPHNYDERLKYTLEALEKYPFAKCFWYPGNVTTTIYLYYLWRVFIYQLIPSFTLDLLLKAFGRPPVALSLQRRAHIGNMELSYFLANSFKSKEPEELKEFRLSAVESDFDIGDHFEIMQTEEGRAASYETHVIGIRRHLLKEDDSSMKASLKRFKM